MTGPIVGAAIVSHHLGHPVVRIPHGDAALIKQVLEIGATALLVPMVENAAQARALVQAMRYPPQGIRGVASGLARSSRWSADAGYLQTANERMCLLVRALTVMNECARAAQVVWQKA